MRAWEFRKQKKNLLDRFEMPEYNPAYKEQRKQVKYKENRSVKKIYKTNEKSIDK